MNKHWFKCTIKYYGSIVTINVKAASEYGAGLILDNICKKRYLKEMVTIEKLETGRTE